MAESERVNPASISMFKYVMFHVGRNHGNVGAKFVGYARTMTTTAGHQKGSRMGKAGWNSGFLKDLNTAPGMFEKAFPYSQCIS
jgi:hypothetical protein